MELKIIVPTHIWEFEPIQINWHYWLEEVFLKSIDIEIIHEQGEAPSGRNVRQRYTEMFAEKDCYVHFLDNDNLVNENVLNWLGYKLKNFTWNALNYNHEPKIIMFGQIWHTNGIKRLNAARENCVPARCDIAQLFVHGSFLKNMVWSGDYENDGQFIAELHKRYPNDFIFVNDVNVWYNALKPHSTLYNGQIITIA
jgi:hypothetical protein